MTSPAQAIATSSTTAVVASEFWHGATARALAEGLRLRGSDVEEVDVNHFLLHGQDPRLRVVRRLLSRLSVGAYNDAVVDALERTRPWLLLLVKGTAVLPSTIQRARELGTRSVVYYPDVYFNHKLLDYEVIRGADLVCTTKRFQMPHLDQTRGAGRSTVVQHGYSPSVHRPRLDDVPEDGYEWDVCYAGNPDDSKLRWLCQLAERFRDRRMIVVGNGWAARARGTALAPFVQDGHVLGDRLARLHQTSRINLAIHGEPPGERGWRDDVSTRTFEIPASKGFMLHVDNAEVRGLFDVPGEIDVFATPQEMCEKVQRYLDDPEARARMLAAAYRRCVPAYSYHARAGEIARLVEEIAP